MIVISAIPVHSFIIISIQCIHTVTLHYLNNDNVWSFISDTIILIYSYIMGTTELWYSQISSTIFHQYRFCEKCQMPIGNAYVKAVTPPHNYICLYYTFNIINQIIFSLPSSFPSHTLALVSLGSH